MSPILELRLEAGASGGFVEGKKACRSAEFDKVVFSWDKQPRTGAKLARSR